MLETEDVISLRPIKGVEFKDYPNIGLVPYNSNFDDKFHINSGETNYEEETNLEQLSCMSENEVKNAFINYVNSKCLYSKLSSNQFELTNLESLNIERYILTTFIETREVMYAFEPYISGDIISNGKRTQPWKFDVKPKKLFHNETVRKEVENTSHLEDCFECEGKGFNFCEWCDGRCIKPCHMCHGIAKPMFDYRTDDNGLLNELNLERRLLYSTQVNNRCINCSNTGYEDCLKCKNGRLECSTCKNKKKLRWFLQVVVKFESRWNDYFKKTNLILPDELIRQTNAKLIYLHESRRIHPIKNYPNEYINKAANDLVKYHSKMFTNSRILAQKQELYLIPITKCFYKINKRNKEKYFHVYGLDNDVYAPDYSCRFDSCCTII